MSDSLQQAIINWRQKLIHETATSATIATIPRPFAPNVSPPSPRKAVSLRGVSRIASETRTLIVHDIDHLAVVIQHYGISHEDFIWQLRQEPGIIDVFEKVWGTEDLICSFDAFNCTFPK